MKFEKTKMVETKVVDAVFCNCCGNRIDEYHCFVSIDKRWGYYSKKDLTEQRADICESCWDKFCATFKIPPVQIDFLDIEHRIPIIPGTPSAPFLGKISDELVVKELPEVEAVQEYLKEREK